MTLRGTARRLLVGGQRGIQTTDQARVRELLSPARCALLVVDVQNDSYADVIGASLVLEAWRSA